MFLLCITEQWKVWRVVTKLTLPPFPGYLNFWKVFVQIPPPRAEKLFKCPHPRENYQITVLTFQKLLKLCMCKHGLLENRKRPRERVCSLACHILSHQVKHCRWTHHYCTSRVAAKIIFDRNWIHRRFHVVSCNNTLIHSINSFHYLYTYIFKYTESVKVLTL